MSPGEETRMQAVPEPEPYAGTFAGGLDSLTASETAMAERQAAQSITTLGNERFPQAGLLGALGWALHRRKEPRSKYEEYMSSRTLTDITRELQLTAPDDEEGDEGKDEPTSSS